MNDDGHSNGHSTDVRFREVITKDDDVSALERRLDSIAYEINAKLESLDLKIDKLLQLHERDRMHRDDVNQRIDAYLTRTLQVESRVDALEGVVTPIGTAKSRNKAARKK